MPPASTMLEFKPMDGGFKGETWPADLPREIAYVVYTGCVMSHLRSRT